ncbi:VWFA domain-containing protein [Fusarium keratoplasticum]|nr:VWFA domain-containing protein [Fusarium keratoplasticum]
MPRYGLFTSLMGKFSRGRNPSKAAQRPSASNDSGMKLDLHSTTTAPNDGIPDDPPPAYSQPTSLRVGYASPVPSLSNITSAEDKYAFLSTFDTIFVIDDSGSMAGRSWHEVREAVGAIAPICTSHDSDGIDVYFLNHRSRNSGSGTQAPGGYYEIQNAAQVQRLFESTRPGGATPTGTRLHSILKPYCANLARKPENMDSTKPVNVIVITDGCPTDDPESIIVHYAKKLDQIEAPPYQVGIQFFQVGKENGAAKALKDLDDNLTDLGIRDMVDTATWSSTSSDNNKMLTANGILKVVLGAVVRRLDRKPTRT